MAGKLSEVTRDPAECACILTGGGSRGSWQAGALAETLDLGIVTGFSTVSGTSVGAINGAGLAMFAPENHKAAGRWIKDLWLNEIKGTHSIWSVRSPLGIPALWNPSIGQTHPLETLLARLIDIEAMQDSGVEYRCPAVDLLSGALVEYSQTDLLLHGIAPILASASFPGFFPPVQIGNHILTDGGVRDIAPIGSAIQNKASKILIFASRDPGPAKPVEATKFSGALSLLHLADRVVDLQSQEILWNDIRTCRRMNDGSNNKKTRKIDLDVLYPSRPLGDPLAFKPDVMKAQIEMGREDARAYWASR